MFNTICHFDNTKVKCTLQFLVKIRFNSCSEKDILNFFIYPVIKIPTEAVCSIGLLRDSRGFLCIMFY